MTPTKPLTYLTKHEILHPYLRRQISYIVRTNNSTTRSDLALVQTEEYKQFCRDVYWLFLKIYRGTGVIAPEGYDENFHRSGPHLHTIEVYVTHEKL